MIYLDNAATTFPKPEAVYKAVDECMRQYSANPGRSGHKMSLRAGRVLLDTRELLAELFNCKNPMHIVFTHNATESINLALKGLLSKGDHVITSSMEHNSIMRPLNSLESIGVEISIVQCDITGMLNIKDLEAVIKRNTKLIVLTHASNVTGTIMPIKDIGKIAWENNIYFMVDAAQTAGIYDIDVQEMRIDLLAFTGHKGLMGPQGTGGLYISEKLDLKTIKEGGTGSKSDSLIQPDIMPDKYESGTPNTPGIAGLCAGVKYIRDVGLENIRLHEGELYKQFIEGLFGIKEIKTYICEDFKYRAPVISLNIKDIGSSDISYILDSQYDIATRSGLHCSPMAHKTIGTFEQGTVRFSLGYFNTKKEIERTIDALIKITREM